MLKQDDDYIMNICLMDVARVTNKLLKSGQA